MTNKKANRYIGTLLDHRWDRDTFPWEEKNKRTNDGQRYHIHVYRVVALAEVNIVAKEESRALNIALDSVKNLKFNSPDCNLIAIIPKE